MCAARNRIRRAEDVGVAAYLQRQPDDGRDHHDIEHDVLDDGNNRGGAQSARIGVGGQDDEGERQRPLAMQSERGQYHADADQLQRDVGHGREDAGERDGDGQRAPAVAAPDEVREGDIAVAAADVPKPRQHHQHVGVSEDRVGQREEAVGAGAVQRGRHGDDGVGRVGVAADQEPGDPRAEGASGEAPLFERVHVERAPPARGPEAGERDESEEQAEDDEGGGVHWLGG